MGRQKKTRRGGPGRAQELIIRVGPNVRAGLPKVKDFLPLIVCRRGQILAELRLRNSVKNVGTQWMALRDLGVLEIIGWVCFHGEALHDGDGPGILP